MTAPDIIESWSTRIADAPGEWFDDLTCSPADLPPERWPFTSVERRTLENDPALCEAVGDLLHARAELRWAAIPTAAALTAWLQGLPDAELEAFLRRHALAHTKARRHAWACASANIISRERAETKLAAIGALPPLRAAWVKLKASLGSTSVTEREEGVVQTGAFLSSLLRGRTPVTRTKGPAPGPADTDALQRLADCLGGDGFLSCAGVDQHVTLALNDDGLAVTAGPSAARMHPFFTLEFCAAGKVIFALPSAEGRVALSLADLLRAAESSVDEVVLNPQPAPPA